MKEALRYLHNAREILKKAPREGHIYTDTKPVREACGTAYLAVLEAINEYLLSRGLTKKELPQSVQAYQETLRKHFGIHNGKWRRSGAIRAPWRFGAHAMATKAPLFREFDYLYDELHLAGYYRGWLHRVDIVKDALNAAEQFIEKLSK